MKLSKISLLVVMLLTLAFNLSAGVKDLPTIDVRGKMYHYHVVEPGETVYSICRILGISKDELLASNPAVSDGLKAGTTLYFPVEENGVTSLAEATGDVVSHKVQKGETIYGLAHSYGISTDELIAQNPSVRGGLKAGQTITIARKGVTKETVTPVAATDEAVSLSAPTSPRHIGYVVKKKETFYSIARAHNLTVAELEDANPGITTLREGQVLSIPVKNAEVAPQPNSETTYEKGSNESDLADQVQNPVPGSFIALTETETPEPAQTDPRQSIRIAVALPFMLNEDNASKSSQRFTEFYKGFLLAVDTLRNSDRPIIVNVYDTEGSVAKVSELIADPELKNNDIIIAPDNAAQLKVLADFARANNVKVLNNFIVRDETYLSNPAVMQGNITSQQMLDKAVDAFAERARHTTPVFINLSDGANDKTDFTDAFKKKLSDIGVSYKTINVDGRLTADDLKMLSAGGSYTFIPASGRQADVNKMLPAIIEWRDEAVLPTVKVIGFPEWVTFRGETLENMHALNTLVYSRFFPDDTAFRSRRIIDKYKEWYGSKMDSAMPRQGLFGYDTGMFIINYLKSGRPYYDGVQNGFSFDEPTADTGVTNNMLYIVNYRPGGMIEKTTL